MKWKDVRPGTMFVWESCYNVSTSVVLCVVPHDNRGYDWSVVYF